MAEETDKKKSGKSKINDKYRLVIFDEDTLGEVKSTRFSMLGVMSLLVFFILFVGLSTFALISYTPLRYTVPGYAEIKNNKVYMDLIERLEEMEEQLDAQRVYTNGLRNILNPTNQEIAGITAEDFKLMTNQNSGAPVELLHFTTPLKGDISASFNLENNHLGVDIVAPSNSPIKSILDGVVVNAGWTEKTGNTISIQHNHDMISIYKHNSTLLKKVGETVSAGEAIAIIGNTGELTTGPHVHFELWNRGVALNPEEYITFE
ncbi:MAG: M23 family metallopeptidase [Saprospiraceae bacterium]|nr:M23 family metallopeptidase [Saprospiraceae bacterium]